MDFNELKKQESKLSKGKREVTTPIGQVAYNLGKATEKGTQAIGKMAIGTLKSFKTQTNPGGKVLVAEFMPLTQGMYGVGTAKMPDETPKYLAVYKAVMNGYSIPEDIAIATGVEVTEVSRILNRLANEGYIKTA